MASNDEQQPPHSSSPPEGAAAPNPTPVIATLLSAMIGQNGGSQRLSASEKIAILLLLHMPQLAAMAKSGKLTHTQIAMVCLRNLLSSMCMSELFSIHGLSQLKVIADKAAESGMNTPGPSKVSVCVYHILRTSRTD